VYGNWGKSHKGISVGVMVVLGIIGLVAIGGITLYSFEERESAQIRQEMRREYQQRNKYQKNPSATPRPIKTSACNLCSGKKTYRCYVCKEGWQYCNACGRDGILPSGKRCNKCIGKGVLPKKCVKCKGTYRVPCVLCTK